MSDFSKFPQIISQNAKILVSPLDWGLGHATRCIPLIEGLITGLNAQITVAANGLQKEIIKEAFPQISFLDAPGYTIKYHKNRAVTIARLALSIPGILTNIRQESHWLNTLLKQQSFDAIVSDNRYGLSHPTIPSFLITHQLLIKTAFGGNIDRFVQNRIYKKINRFSECWVPDYPSEPSLAGELSHPDRKLSIPVRYIGPLTRIKPMPALQNTQLLVLLSGPEPQRSLLEGMIIKQWTENPGADMILVRGLPGHSSPPPEVPRAIIYNHLPAKELSQQIANAKQILCRSGYSSIMDLLPLGKKCIMIPTPGQTEQEYLAAFLSKQGRISTIKQSQLNISDIIRGLS